MHPLFVTLLIETGAGDLPAGDQDGTRRACGQARPISPGQQGCRRSPGSPASPLGHEPARTGGECRRPAGAIMRPARLFSSSPARIWPPGREVSR